ncbi:MAG: hypothetical protein KKB31_01200 [Nanoarchaeota archaeon]|nr:hypothetical protein [Nanoarchaeota archaeon]
MSIRLTYKYVKKQIEFYEKKLHSKKYKNAKIKLEVECWNNHIYMISWDKFKQGRRCPECAKIKKRNYFNFDLEYIKNTTKKLEPNYICKAEEYKNARTKIPFDCDRDHEFWMTWGSFWSGSRCPICRYINKKGKNNPNWRGGAEVAWHDTYALQIDWIEKVRRNPENKDYLQVKCTNSNCRKWFNPTRKEVQNRIRALNGEFTEGAELRFYCSDECKQSCSVYRKILYPEGYKIEYRNSNIQKEWSDLVKQRDEYQCIKCNSGENPEAHHINGINENIYLAWDLDAGITLCKDCHKEVHKELGCRRIDLRRDNLCPQ